LVAYGRRGRRQEWEKEMEGGRNISGQERLDLDHREKCPRSTEIALEDLREMADISALLHP
jgi:hypothetical protein